MIMNYEPMRIAIKKSGAEITSDLTEIKLLQDKKWQVGVTMLKIHLLQQINLT